MNKDMDRDLRIALVQKRERELGLPVTRKDIDLRGAVYDGGGEIAINPEFWLEGQGGPAQENAKRMAKAKMGGRGNSATFALMSSFGRAYAEPSLAIWRGPWMDFERSERLDDHPAVGSRGLLRRPNPVARFSMSVIQGALAKSKLAAGNFYLVKARTGGGSVLTNTDGAVVGLWPVWARVMSPAVYARTDPRESNGWIDYFSYERGKGRPAEIPVENVIHFRNGLREDEPRLGIGVVEEFALEVASDTQAALLVDAVFKNLGFPGLVFSPEAQSGQGLGIDASKSSAIPLADREAIKASIIARTSGSRRGEPIVLSRPTKFEQFKVDLAQYNLEYVWKHVETRMAGVIGWPAILAGLAAGLDAATYANVASLKRFSTENAIIPVWEEDSEVWTEGLADDLGLKANEWIGYDYRRVRSLQEDREAVWKRAGEHWQANALTIGEHHQMLDLELPSGVDPDLRRVEIEASAQLSRLLAPALGKSKTWLLDGSMIRPAPLVLEAPPPRPAKAADVADDGKWTPADTETLGDDELEIGEIGDADLDDALEIVGPRITEVEPDFDGVLDAEPDAPAKGRARKDVKVRWRWDDQKQRYRWPNTGRAVPEARVFALRDRLIGESGQHMRALAQDHLDGKLTLRQFQTAMRDEIKANHLAMRTIGRGGVAQMGKDDREAARAMINSELGYLKGFGKDIAGGNLTRAQILTRAESYAGASMRQSFADGRLFGHKAAGFGYKERILRSARPCATCVDEAGRGRVPIDEPGFVIGGTDCKNGDRCDLIFSREEE